MNLNGRPVTVAEFTDMDRISGWQLGLMMEGRSPTFMLLCDWIVQRREKKNLTWDEYRKQDLDLQTVEARLEITEPDPTNGDASETSPISADTGASVQET